MELTVTSCLIKFDRKSSVGNSYFLCDITTNTFQLVINKHFLIQPTHATFTQREILDYISTEFMEFVDSAVDNNQIFVRLALCSQFS